MSAFFAYVLGSVFFFIALSKGKNTSITILLAYVLPILISIFLAKMMFNDKINKMMALGMAITMVGLVMTVYYKEKIIKNLTIYLGFSFGAFVGGELLFRLLTP